VFTSCEYYKLHHTRLSPVTEYLFQTNSISTSINSTDLTLLTVLAISRATQSMLLHCASYSTFGSWFGTVPFQRLYLVAAVLPPYSELYLAVLSVVPGSSFTCHDVLLYPNPSTTRLMLYCRIRSFYLVAAVLPYLNLLYRRIWILLSSCCCTAVPEPSIGCAAAVLGLRSSRHDVPYCRI
jgi:hypothetical protein